MSEPAGTTVWRQSGATPAPDDFPPPPPDDLVAPVPDDFGLIEYEEVTPDQQ